jgi:hypothetical protein
MGIFAPFAYIKNIAIEPSIVYDADAQNFFTATGITNTGLKGAVNDLVLDLKSASLWTPMDVIYPFVGDSLPTLGTQLSYNLKNTGSFQATLNNGTGSSDLSGYGSSVASTRHINTNYIPRTFRPNGPFHASVYTTSSGSAGAGIDIGAFVSSTNTTTMFIGRNLSGDSSQKGFAAGGGSGTEFFNTSATGFYAGSYDNGITPKTRILYNGTQIATDNRTMNNSNNSNSTIALLLGGIAETSGVTNRTTKKYQFLSFGGGLTNTEMTSLNTIVQTFQSAVDTAMGTSRAV